MTTRRALALGLLCVMLAPLAVARAQQVAYAANLMTELDSATQAALTSELARAQTRGLPIAPLVAKMREGQIKRAAPSRIRTAVAALAIRLDSARSALGAQSRTTELVAGADALSAGADAIALRAVRSASGARDLAAPLGALAQLVASGVPTRRATQMIVELVRRATAPSQLADFGNAVEADVGAGVPAEESAIFRLRTFEATGFSDSFKATVAAPGTGQALGQPATDGSRPPRRKP